MCVYTVLKLLYKIPNNNPELGVLAKQKYFLIYQNLAWPEYINENARFRGGGWYPWLILEMSRGKKNWFENQIKFIFHKILQIMAEFLFIVHVLLISHKKTVIFTSFDALGFNLLVVSVPVDCCLTCDHNDIHIKIVSCVSFK